MATTTRRTSTKKAATSKPAPEPEELEDDEELDELEEDTVEDAPKAKKAEEVVFGVADICKLLNKNVPDGKKPVTPRELRTLIRKMAREDNARVDREITAGNRTRYSWSGPKDPEVVAIVKAFRGGELEADKQEKLAALKARKAEKAPAKPAEGKTTRKATKKAAPVVEEDEDVEELELDDEDED